MDSLYFPLTLAVECSVGKLVGIARRDTTRAPMETLDHADVSVTSGVASDFRGASKKRAVTVLAADVWKDVYAELGATIPWTTRRSNFLVDGIDLPRRAGDIITVGDVRLQVTQEVDPCFRMDEQWPGLKAALTPEWRGGVGCVVLQGGSVAVGDPVAVLVSDT